MSPPEGIRVTSFKMPNTRNCLGSSRERVSTKDLYRFNNKPFDIFDPASIEEFEEAMQREQERKRERFADEFNGMIARELPEGYKLSDPERKLYKARAMYHTTGKKEALLNYLPVQRHLIKNDPDGLKRYNQLVDLIRSRVQFLESVKDDDQRSYPLRDESIKYLIASQIAEIYHNKTDLIQNIVNKGLLTIHVSRELSRVASGYFKGSYNKAFILAGNQGMSNVRGPTELWSVGLHEFTHRLTAKQPSYNPIDYNSVFKATGFLPIDDNDLKDRFEVVRQKLIDQYNETGTSPLREYAFKKYSKDDTEYVEFPTVAIETFYQLAHRSNALETNELGQELYEVLKEWLGVDPIAIGKTNDREANDREAREIEKRERETIAASIKELAALAEGSR